MRSRKEDVKHCALWIVKTFDRKLSFRGGEVKKKEKVRSREKDREGGGRM